MSGPSSTPRGEHAGRPGTHWNTVLGTTGEQLVDDNTPSPVPNRATRRAAMRAARRTRTKEQPMTGPSTVPLTFGLIREQDVTGVSGTGRVADGVLWPDGTVSVRWRGDRPSIVHWAGLDDVRHIHGHGGHTRIAWDDAPSAPGRAGTVEMAFAAVRALHREWDGADPACCAHCQDGQGTPLPYPCPTIRALDGIEGSAQ